jgi:hypothetical protein
VRSFKSEGSYLLLYNICFIVLASLTICNHGSAPKYRKNKFKFVHLLDNRYSIGPTENIVDIIHTTNKGKMLNILEKFYIHKETSINVL